MADGGGGGRAGGGGGSGGGGVEDQAEPPRVLELGREPGGLLHAGAQQGDARQGGRRLLVRHGCGMGLKVNKY